MDAHEAGRLGNVSRCVGICDDASLLAKLDKFCVDVQLRTGISKLGGDVNLYRLIF